MTRELFFKVLKAGAVACLLFVLLFADTLRSPFPGLIGFGLRELNAVLVDPESQWMACLCLGVYCTTFFFLRYRGTGCFWRMADPALWLACGLIIVAFFYAIDYSSSPQALTLLGGAALGQGAAFWADLETQSGKGKMQNCLGILVVSILVVLLAGASVLRTGAARTFEYHSQARWSGPWDNPNIFGLLMGTGVLLALGLTVASFLMPSGKIGQWFCALLCLLAAVLTGRGLMHSYSRGAWLGAVCGLAYLFWHWIHPRICNTGGSEGFSRGPCISRFKRSWFPLSVVLSSAVILAFWHFRETNWHPAQRALSSVNTADFSWRNRTAAWEGALQIMAEHPWTGTAWNQPQPLYGHYYLPPKLNETGAIELNDYLTLGATVGIPALFCFGMFVWLSLKGKVESGKRKAETQGVDWLRTVCHAGAIVLLVGFWFDGGLFKLPTAATFWILLELGNVRTGETNEALNHE